jgi:hypothetical protein
MHKIYTELGPDLYYTDTDSVFTTRKLPETTELGGLKLEYTLTEAIFLLPKTYAGRGPAIEKTVMKGFEKKKLGALEFSDFQHALEGDLKRMSIVRDERIAKFKTALRKGAILTRLPKENRQLRATYDKRVIYMEHGSYKTKPLHLQLNNKES